MIWELFVLIGLVIGSVTDIVRREVPDMLNYSMIAIGFLLAIIISLQQLSYRPILSSVFGFSIAFIISMILFKTGQWGGGDAKMLWGIGALSGFSINEFPFPFLFQFLVLSMIVGAVYGLFWMFYLALKNGSKFTANFKKLKDTKAAKYTRIAYLILAGILLLTVLLLRLPFETTMALFLVLGLFVLSFYLYLFVKSVEQGCLVIEIKVSKLTPGDWITNNPVVNGKKFECEKIGVTEKQIAYLKKHNVQSVEVTEGIPFVPAFLIAFLII